MGQKTEIEWADFVWNCLRGCSIKSPGCHHCYAAVLAARFSGPGQPYEGLAYFDANGRAHWTGKVRPVPEKLADPLRWRTPRKVFVNSMSDLFHEDVPFEFIDHVFAVMALARRHTFQVLTKRAARMAAYFQRPWNDVILGILQQYDSMAANAPAPQWLHRFQLVYRVTEQESAAGKEWEGRLPLAWPLPNVWLGVSVEDQQRANERIPHLLQTPAAVRFLSCEPLLGSVDLSRWTESGLECSGCDWTGSESDDLQEKVFDDGDPEDLEFVCPSCGDPCAHTPLDEVLGGRAGIHWVIVGGESGHGARPCDVKWIRSIVGQCRDAGVPAFVKQLGSRPYDSDGARRFPEANRVITEREYREKPDAVAASLAITLELMAIDITDKKGGNIDDFPPDLRVREFLRVAEAAHAR